MLADGTIHLDASRVAAQIVVGVRFIGAGLIFRERTIIHGLTTAASMWFTAAIGMASGAGLALLALVTTGGYFVVMLRSEGPGA